MDTSLPLLLALETSCDESAVAILRGRELLASEIASQTDVHRAYGGVVPEVASRNHVVHLPRLLSLAVEKAGITLSDVDAFAATSGPGLATSLMIGASTAKGLAIGFAKPYLAINHLEGHLLSPFLGGDAAVKPNMSLVVSGGHTLLVQVDGLADYRIVGRTVDDAAGEAFDKVAKLLGLGYPGGPEIERRALLGDAKRFSFPRSMLGSGDSDFSFSGLKTSVRYTVDRLKRESSAIPSEAERSHGVAERVATRSLGCARDDRVIDDLCASFQAAVIDVLVRKTITAAQSARVSLVTLSGGVSCNRALRTALAAAAENVGLQFIGAPAALSTDNAAMIAFAAMLRFEHGLVSEVTQEIDPNLALA